jgi:hypothetical protein
MNLLGSPGTSWGSGLLQENQVQTPGFQPMEHILWLNIQAYTSLCGARSCGVEIGSGLHNFTRDFGKSMEVHNLQSYHSYQLYHSHRSGENDCPSG